jgi:hypothetical protein
MNNNQITLDNLNNFINNANKTLSCDSNCQKMNRENKLKQIYLDSLTNSASSSAQEQVAYKNYIISTQGQSAYDDEIDKQLKIKADSIAKAYKKIFEENIYNTELSLGTYKGLMVNFKNIIDYYLSYLNKNVKFENDNKIKTSDVLTNQRKTYYENQNIDRIKYINVFLFYFYYLFVFLFIVFYFIYPSELSNIKLLMLLFLLIIYPFIASKIFTFLVYTYNFIINNILPKNVYKTI